ncbi:MAG: AAA family ATPase [Candidatus Colwellbacteria bacterium]|nr:AAA family ATPase [Candidatus Colwellbacteria bacterium]
MMKLIVLYGPPAVGKLTVARELAKLTGLKIFHNHLTVDFLDPLIGYGTKGFFKLLNRIRLSVLETAAQNGNHPGFIFTWVYAKGEDDDFVKEAKDAVQGSGGKIYWIRLFCDEAELMRRVTKPSRHEFGKITTAEDLKKNLQEADLTAALLAQNTLEIDNTNIFATEVAKQILDFVETAPFN